MKRRVAYKIDKRWREKFYGVSPRILSDRGELPWSRQTWDRAHHIWWNRDFFHVSRGLDLCNNSMPGIRHITRELWNKCASLPAIHWRRATRNITLPNLERFEGLNWTPHKGHYDRSTRRRRT